MGKFLMDTKEEIIARAAELIRNANGKVVVLTGAGISTNSGIPDFRGKSEESFYNKHSENDISAKAYANHRMAFIDAYFEKFDKLKYASPNLAHNLLVEWEEKGIISGVVTQNIDGLHKNKSLIEMHGNSRRLQKVDNGGRVFRYYDEYISLEGMKDEDIRRHMINGYKPDVVLFGEDVRHWGKAKKMVESGFVTIVIGTSMRVYPFASLPGVNKKRNHRVIVINNEPVDIKHDLYIEGDASEIMKEIHKLLGF